MEQLALKLRREWGIDNYAPIDIFSLVLEKIGNLTLLWLEMDEDVSGCCTETEDDSVILINSNHSKGRQNFTLAHELYHLKFDDSSDSPICMINSKNPIERKANEFASYFLMPKCALEDYYSRHDIGKWTLRDIVRCEQFFQISHRALLTRLRDERYIDEDEFDYYSSLIISRCAANLGFDTTLYRKSPDSKKHYVLGNLIPLAEELYEKEEISKGLRNEIFLKNFRADLVYNLEEDNGFD
ncbi:MAG: ImmA/IrrE family metallo-endopeptidase [Methanobrevibacter olleyae]|uniref:ImmA/IrrE family metallo-endopeptidase n=1 Tax=Methanobrevibacter olleyae TaxID=294671 RepID=A0A8T3VK14_METOL|nr:ImmA/IrrE family metallo-endopeptidase [Methanobrevibacter olleyae]